MTQVQTIKNTGLYLLAAIIPAAMSLVVNPFVALNMSPQDYAIVGYYNSFTILFTPLISLYLTHYYSKRYYEYDEASRIKLKSLIFRIFFVLSPIIVILIGIGLWCYSTYFNKSSTIDFFPYAIIYLLTLYFQCYFTLELVDMKMRRKHLSYFKFSLFQSFLILISTILLVIICKWGAIGKLSAVLMETVILFIIVLKRNINIINVHVSPAQIKEALLFCFPLILAAVMGFFTKGYDSILLERLGNNTEFAYYSIGLQFSSYLGMITTAIQNAFQSDIYEAVKNNNTHKVFKILSVFLIVSLVIVVVFCSFAPLIVKILTYGRYTLAVPYARITSISLIFSVAYYFLSTIIIAKGYTMYTLINKIIVTLFTSISYPLIINKFEYIGGAWALSCAYAMGIFIYVIILLYLRYAKNSESRL